MPSQNIASETKRCRLCGSQQLITVLSLGNQYVSDFITSGGEHPKSPLELIRCRNCSLVQLRHTFPRSTLYRHYWYRSGISHTMREALEDVISKAIRVAHPTKGDLVIDTGCNDGTLLRSYPRLGLLLIGFEPAQNLIEDAREGTDWIFNDFFHANVYEERFGIQKAKIITSVAMFYDLDDPNSFTADIAKCMAQDGVWVIQQNYLATMLEKNGFDNIGHEHLEYYSLATMEKLVARHELEIFEVETNDVNGGSFRTYVGHQDRHPIGESVKVMREHEKELSLDEDGAYRKFAYSIENVRSQLRTLVMKEVGRGKTVYAYGASNRGNTILQYCGLDYKLIRKATDANREKWGRKTVGTQIPIVSKEEARKDKPDYFLVLPHHFLEEIKLEEKQFLKNGGKLIVPLPNVRIVV